MQTWEVRGDLFKQSGRERLQHYSAGPSAAPQLFASRHGAGCQPLTRVRYSQTFVCPEYGTTCWSCRGGRGSGPSSADGMRVCETPVACFLVQYLSSRSLQRAMSEICNPLDRSYGICGPLRFAIQRAVTICLWCLSTKASGVFGSSVGPATALLHSNVACCFLDVLHIGKSFNIFEDAFKKHSFCGWEAAFVMMQKQSTLKLVQVTHKE